MNGIVDDEELKPMIDHAYMIVVKKLSKKLRMELKNRKDHENTLHS